MKPGRAVEFKVPGYFATLHLVADEATFNALFHPKDRGVVYTVAEVAALKRAGITGPELLKVISTKATFSGTLLVGEDGKLCPPEPAPEARRAAEASAPRQPETPSSSAQKALFR